MRKIIFKLSNGWNVPMETVFKNIPELEVILEDWDFKYESRIEEFMQTVKKYLVFDTDIVAPMAIITNKVMGVSIKHNGSRYYLMIRELEGGE